MIGIATLSGGMPRIASESGGIGAPSNAEHVSTAIESELLCGSLYSKQDKDPPKTAVSLIIA
jgi:hypothetical protein